MPIYEFQCLTCGHRYELLLREDTVIQCPKCTSDNSEKELSVPSPVQWGKGGHWNT